MRHPSCVGALILNAQGQVFVQRRSQTRVILPGVWDIVGGHIETGETPEMALAREVHEETGWRLRRIIVQIADWEWEHSGFIRRELDYIVEVDGDLSMPQLEPGKHDAYTWLDADSLELMMSNRTDGDDRLQRIIADAIEFHLSNKSKVYRPN
jgi:8-oxo-dGTP pyrophosphatase MutT (NUDIX family)